VKNQIYLFSPISVVFIWDKTYSGKRASPWRSSHQLSLGDDLLPRDCLSRGPSRNQILLVFSPLDPRKTSLACGQGRRAGWAGRDPCPRRGEDGAGSCGSPDRASHVAAEPRAAASNGSDGKATSGPVSQPLMPIDRGPRGVPPRLGTSIAVTAEQQPRLLGAAWRAQPGHQHHVGTQRSITPPAKGPRQRVPHHPPSPRCEGAGLGSPTTPNLSPQGAPSPVWEHPQRTQLDPVLRKAPAAPTMRPQWRDWAPHPMGHPVPPRTQVPPAERGALSPSSAHRSRAAR